MKKNKLISYILIICELLFPLIISAEEKIDNTSALSPIAKFIPDISLNTDFSYVYRNISNTQYNLLGIPGFSGGGQYATGFTANGMNEGVLNQKRGINFNYGDLALYSNVDPFFDMLAVIGLDENGAGIEEAYARTLALPFNLQIKAGKFYSSFGRLNEMHSHAWDFSDQPLVHLAFFGSGNLNEKGAKLSWLMPVPFYLLAGAEALTADNASSFGSTGFTDQAGVHTVQNGELFPQLYVGYIKTSFDIENLVILLGVSGATGPKRLDNGIANSGGNGIYGTTDLLGADLYLKYLIDSYRYIAWQTEFIYRYTNGNQFGNDGTAASLTQNQSGFYTQLVFRFAEQWRVGIRYDLIQKNQSILAGANQNLPQNLPRYTAMIEFSPSEFSKFRLQYNYDMSQYNGSSKLVNNRIAFDVNMFIGTHAAHTF